MATALAATPPQYRRVTGRAPKLPQELRALAGRPRPAIPGQNGAVTLAEVEESHEYVRAVKRLRSSCKIEVEASLHDLQVKTAYLGELPRIDCNVNF